MLVKVLMIAFRGIISCWLKRSIAGQAYFVSKKREGFENLRIINSVLSMFENLNLLTDIDPCSGANFQ